VWACPADLLVALVVAAVVAALVVSLVEAFALAVVALGSNVSVDATCGTGFATTIPPPCCWAACAAELSAGAAWAGCWGCMAAVPFVGAAAATAAGWVEDAF
jgi:hypothetical protein